MNIYQKMSSNGWHIDTPNGCGKRESETETEREQDISPEAQS